MAKTVLVLESFKVLAKLPNFFVLLQVSWQFCNWLHFKVMNVAWIWTSFSFCNCMRQKNITLHQICIKLIGTNNLLSIPIISTKLECKRYCWNFILEWLCIFDVYFDVFLILGKQIVSFFQNNSMQNIFEEPIVFWQSCIRCNKHQLL